MKSLMLRKILNFLIFPKFNLDLYFVKVENKIIREFQSPLQFSEHFQFSLS